VSFLFGLYFFFNKFFEDFSIVIFFFEN